MTTAADPFPASAPPRVPAGRRIYAIGDVHGRLDLLEELIAAIRRDVEGRRPADVSIVLLGDIIDRGPDSAALVSRCRDLAGRFGRFIVLKGNHEAMMLLALEGSLPVLNMWMRNGGAAALESWGLPVEGLRDGASAELLRDARARIPVEERDWLRGLPLVHRAGDYLFVHAGIAPGIAIDAQEADDLIWIRNEFLDSDADHGCIVVHGHSIRLGGIDERPNRIGIDTGAYHTHRLTALALEGGDRWTLATTGGGGGGGGGRHGEPAGGMEADVAAMLPRGPLPEDAATAAARRGMLPLLLTLLLLASGLLAIVGIVTGRAEAAAIAPAVSPAISAPGGR